MCGSNNLPIGKVNCIPKESICPLTEVKYNMGDLVLSRDPSLGKPITDLRLSEFGAPCVHWDTNFNAYTNKTRALLFPAEYTRGCPNIDIDGHIFNTSNLYKKVEGFQTTSEYSLMMHNQWSGSNVYKK